MSLSSSECIKSVALQGKARQSRFIDAGAAAFIAAQQRLEQAPPVEVKYDELTVTLQVTSVSRHYVVASNFASHTLFCSFRNVTMASTWKPF